ncbi:hypothetical protein H6P81_020420 [Aristolochia fimbriata]|uniref:MPV17 n=1 Tax=Aristolochia fimbriata TaxID=158543 RepID=A0AAV7DUC1_ARIFI|nr:hypothetical protein H6P81_020420 [Aristolochia fimbriata]
MSASFLRNGGRVCCRLGVLYRNSLLPDSSLLAGQSRRACARSPVLNAKSGKWEFASWSSSFCSSSASSSRNGFVGWYLGMIESRPVLTKSITAGIIFTVADVSSQMITLENSDSLDPVRTLRMAGYGLLLSGPSLHIWFNSISRFIPKRDVLNTMKKIFIGQTVYGPMMTTVFFSLNAALQGETRAEIIARLKRDLIPTFKSGLVYWPICDFITFKFIPVRLQPLVSNSFSFLWTIYITYMASLKRVGNENLSDE